MSPDQDPRQSANEIYLSLEDALPDELTPYLTHPNRFLRLRLASHPNLTADQITSMAIDENRFVRERICARNDLPLAVQSILSQDDVSVLESLAKNHSINEETLCRMARATNEPSSSELMGHIAANPNSPPALLLELVELNNVHVLRSLASRKNITLELCDLIIRSNLRSVQDVAVMMSMAKNPDLTGEMLKLVVSTHQAEAVLLNVARNPNTPGDVLSTLAESQYSSVHFLVAEHPATPHDCLQSLLSRHRNSIYYTADGKREGRPIIEGILKNPNAPSQMQDELRAAYLNDTADYRKFVAECTLTPVTTLIKLATRDPAKQVKDLAIKTLAQLNDHDLYQAIATGSLQLSSKIGPSSRSKTVGDSLLSLQLTDLYQRIQAIELEHKICAGIPLTHAQTDRASRSSSLRL